MYVCVLPAACLACCIHAHLSDTTWPNQPTDQLSPKSDIWSFGLSLWALATGQFPFEEAVQDEFDLRMASECDAWHARWID